MDSMLRAALKQRPEVAAVDMHDGCIEVGGHIDALGLECGVCLICNEECKLMGLPANRRVGGDIIVGTFLIVGEADGEFCSLSDEDAAYYAAEFAKPMPSHGGPDELTQWTFHVY